MTRPHAPQDDGTDQLVLDAEIRARHELGEVAATLYRLVWHLQAEFPFLALTLQDEEDLLRATGVLLEWDLIEPGSPDPPEWVTGSR